MQKEAGISHKSRTRDGVRLTGKPGAVHFLSVHAVIYNVFNTQRHLISRQTLRTFRAEAMATWQAATAAA
jgi:putative transposase